MIHHQPTLPPTRLFEATGTVRVPEPVSSQKRCKAMSRNSMREVVAVECRHIPTALLVLFEGRGQFGAQRRVLAGKIDKKRADLTEASVGVGYERAAVASEQRFVKAVEGAAVGGIEGFVHRRKQTWMRGVHFDQDLVDNEVFSVARRHQVTARSESCGCSELFADDSLNGDANRKPKRGDAGEHSACGVDGVRRSAHPHGVPEEESADTHGRMCRPQQPF